MHSWLGDCLFASQGRLFVVGGYRGASNLASAEVCPEIGLVMITCDESMIGHVSDES